MQAERLSCQLQSLSHWPAPPPAVLSVKPARQSPCRMMGPAVAVGLGPLVSSIKANASLLETLMLYNATEPMQ